MALRRDKDITDEVDDLRRKIDRLIRKGIDKFTPLYIRKIPKDVINFTRDIVSVNGLNKKVIPKDTISFNSDTVSTTKCAAFYLGSTPGGQNDCLVKMGFWEAF